MDLMTLLISVLYKLSCSSIYGIGKCKENGKNY